MKYPKNFTKNHEYYIQVSHKGTLNFEKKLYIAHATESISFRAFL